jgi:AcrR family transcriptional regulator
MMLPAISRRNRRIELGERSRQRIREVASELMAERGYVGTSVSAIAKRSRLPASSLYWHFGSKQGLLAAVAAEGGSQWLDLIPEWEDLTGSTLERLDKMLREIARQLSGRRDLIKLLLTLYIERDRIDQASVRTIRGVRRAAVGKFKPAMKALIESLGGTSSNFMIEELSNFALSFTNGCFIDHEVDPEATNLARRFEQLLPAVVAVAEASIAVSSSASRKGRKKSARIARTRVS